MAKQATINKYRNCLNTIHERANEGITTQELFEKYKLDKSLITEGLKFGYLIKENGKIKSLNNTVFSTYQAKKIADKINARKVKSATKSGQVNNDTVKPLLSTDNYEEILQFVDEGTYIISDELLFNEIRRRGYLGDLIKTVKIKL
jgi:ABC-type Zn uptake system ZnuABC Zn-binding protein ZnuA